MPIQPVSGEIKAQPLNENFSFLDSKVDQVNGGPKETFTSVSALQSKYPSGSNSAMLVTDANGSNGYLYTWNGTSWIKGVLYQSQGIPTNSITTEKYKDESIAPVKTSFMKHGNNLFDPDSVVRGYYVDLKGNIVELATYSYIKDIPLKAGESILFYDSNGQILPMRFVIAYDANGAVLTDESAQNVTSTYFTASGSTVKVTVSIATVFLTRNLMLSYGTTPKAFEEFSILPESYVDLSDKQILTVKKLVAEGSQDTESNKKVMVTINGQSISVKSYDKGHEIIISGVLNGSSNGSFNFANTSIDGSIVHSTPDDITPVRTFATVGANHGYPYLISITVASHNKTNADLGSVWSDGTNNFTLIEVASATVLKFLPDYVDRSDGSINVSVSSLLGNLTHVSGAANTSNIVISTQSTGQLYPSIRNVEQKSNELSIQDMTVFLDEFSLVESYDVLDYKSLIDWSKANVGKKYIDNLSQIDSVATYSTAYSFKEGGQCLINSSVLFKKKTLIGNLGFLQAAALNDNAIRFIPDVLTVSDYDFSKGVNLSEYNQNLIISKTNLKDSANPMVRYIDIYENYGFTLGYILDKLDSSDSKRIANATSLWDLRSTKKSYPITVDTKVGATVDAGTYFSIEGYRKYFYKEHDLTNFSIVEDSEAFYVFIDANKSIPYISKKLRNVFGRKVNILRSENFTLFNDYVSSEGITFAITADYGTAVLKVMK